VRLLVLLATTYAFAQAATSLLATGRLALTPELGVFVVAVPLAQWAALRLFRRAFAARRG